MFAHKDNTKNYSYPRESLKIFNTFERFVSANGIKATEIFMGI